MITSGKRSQNGFSLNVCECPICGRAYRSQEEVSLHVDSCVNDGDNRSLGGNDVDVKGDRVEESGRGKLDSRVGEYLSEKLPEGSMEVVIRLLRNVAKDPENGKFRRIRMANLKIREAVRLLVGLSCWSL